MINKFNLKYVIFILVSLILVFIDQATKILARNYLKGKSPVVLIDGILEFVYTENEGAAFGILQGRQEFFFGLTIFVIAALLYMLYKMDFNKHNIFYFIFMILIFSGAIGNFIDRVKNRYVVDFIYFKPIDFPVFNFADICITCACILMIVATFTVYRKE